MIQTAYKIVRLDATDLGNPHPRQVYSLYDTEMARTYPLGTWVDMTLDEDIVAPAFCYQTLAYAEHMEYLCRNSYSYARRSRAVAVCSIKPHEGKRPYRVPLGDFTGFWRRGGQKLPRQAGMSLDDNIVLAERLCVRYIVLSPWQEAGPGWMEIQNWRSQYQSYHWRFR